MATVLDTPQQVASAIVERVGSTVVLGLPIGIGKGTHIADALFDLAVRDKSISLTIFTGLTLEVPLPGSDLEQRFVGPIAKRLYGDWPVPKYASALRDNSLPENVEVHEFYLRPGAYLGNDYVQQRYANINYSEVVDELMRLGVNVVAQLVAKSDDGSQRYSLGSNPEVTLDLLPRFEARRSSGKSGLLVGQVSKSMPYMPGDSELGAEAIDLVLDNDEYNYELFSLPNRRVSDGDYATAMHVASLVRDGGTIQVGIGSLSDAVAHCLKLRNTEPHRFAEVLSQLPGGSSSARRGVLPIETTPFTKGLYSSTELLSDALFSLFEADIVKRSADDQTKTVLHAGFFIGSNALYDGIRNLSAERRRLINMTRISYVNTLFGDELRKRAQRSDARFVNETMMVTLLGAAVSDGLADGRVVSGVGGQFDFVSMAQSLDGAMSILMCRAARMSRGKRSSNVRWNYGHTTVPRHHRDVYVTEYGVAATRGCSDRDIIDRILHVSDAEFHAQLTRKARAAGKIESDYSMSPDAGENRPERVAAVFDTCRESFPPFPLGTELTNEEAALAEALAWLQDETSTTGGKLRCMASSIFAKPDDKHSAALERMGFGNPQGAGQRVMRRMLGQALKRTQQ